MSRVCLPDLAALERLGAALAAATRPPLVVGLSGPLGAGKTALARAWLRALGHEGSVRSPTYTLIESYPIGPLWIHHMDLYRLADPGELAGLGLPDLRTDDAVWLVEWPERGAGWLPAADWSLALDFADGGRVITGLPAEVVTRFDHQT